MCGRFTSLLSPELLTAVRDTFGVPVPESAGPRYNIAPTQQVWVIRNEGDQNRFDLMKWGLVPAWSKDQKIANHLINARSETVHEKPSFRRALKYRRCIVPTAGFYEWLRTGTSKQPYFIHMADGSPMCLAGLWEQWKAPEEENYLETFTILTTAANELLSPIHDRQPVILQPDDYSLWLSHSMHDPDQLRGMYQPVPSSLLGFYKVSDMVNNVRNEVPECIERV